MFAQFICWTPFRLTAEQQHAVAEALRLVALKQCEVRDMMRELDTIYTKNLVPLLKTFPRSAWNGVKTDIVHTTPMPLNTYLRYVGDMSGCINHLFLVNHGHATNTSMNYTPKKVRATLQVFLTVLRQIGLILDTVTAIIDDAESECMVTECMRRKELDGSNIEELNSLISKLRERPQRSENPSMVSILDKTICECMSKVQEEEEEEEEGEEEPLRRTPALPLPYHSDYASRLVDMIGVTRHAHIDGHLAGAMTSSLTQEQLRMALVLITSNSIYHNIDRHAIEKLVRVCSALLSIYQKPYTSATLPRTVLSFMDALKELEGCGDDVQLQQLLLYVQYHLEKGVRYIDRANMVFARECSGGHYIVPYVAPMEDDADVLAPRPQEYSTLKAHVQAISAVVNKIMASSA
jgi:hypothetical protein